jgi:hypothetical protein
MSKPHSIDPDVPLAYEEIKVIATSLAKVLQQQLEDVDEGYMSADVLSDSKASFHLGMKLFSSKTVTEIEREVQVSLRQTQVKLDSVPSERDVANKEHGVALIIQHLLQKIQFLLECSQARSTLDESISYSTAVLAPQEMRNMKKSTELWVQAHIALDKAKQVLVEMESSQVLLRNEMEKQLSSSIQNCDRLYEAIHRLVRRQKLDILGEAEQIWTTCIQISSRHIFVGAPKQNRGSLPSSDGMVVFFGILDSLMHRDNDVMDKAFQSILRKLTSHLQQTIFQPILDDLQVDRYTSISFRSPSGDETFDGITAVKDGNRLDWASSRGTSNINPNVLKDLNLKDYAASLQKNRPTNHSELQRDVTTKLEHWENATSFLHVLLSFVADNVLLQNSHACSFVAKRLFGRPTNLATILGEGHDTESENPGRTAVGNFQTQFCRFGEDDDGVLLEPLLEAIGKTCVAPLRLPQNQLLPQLNIIAQRLQSVFHPMIQELSARNILPVETATYFSNYLKSIHQMYINHRRCQLLNEARDLIVSTDYHNTTIVGEEINIPPPLFAEERPNSPAAAAVDSILSQDGLAVFKLHRASISCTAHEAMLLCRKILDDVVEHYNYRLDAEDSSNLPNLSHFTSPVDFQITYCATMYRTARETLDLFRAIIPVQHGKEVAQVPRTAAILHNDGVFFAHHCLTLGLEYKSQFHGPVSEISDVKDEDDNISKARDQLLRQHCMFIDMVPLFRDIADRSLSDMLSVQKHQIQELVRGRITIFHVALKSNEYLSEWSDAEMAFEAGIYHIRHVIQNWKPPILSNDIFNRAIGYLVDGLLTLFLEEIEQATDISATACPFLHSLLTKAMEELDRVWEPCPNKKQYSRVWDRCQVCGLFMNMSILDIQNSLSSGLFRSFTASELAHLITSCFDDTPKRRALLQLIASQQP